MTRLIGRLLGPICFLLIIIFRILPHASLEMHLFVGILLCLIVWVSFGVISWSHFPQKSTLQKLGLFLGPVLFVLSYLMPLPGMDPAARAVLASTLWVATWWTTEALPIPATSIMPIILLPLSGGQAIGPTVASYGDKMLFLFIGGFMIAKAMEYWNLHRRIALFTVRAVGTDAPRIILGFMIASAFLSMWISNTATTMMMVPIGAAVILQLSGNESQPGTDQFGKALLLGIAYAASIGGLATIIGTPTNGIFISLIGKNYGLDVDFAEWISLGLPLVILLIGGMCVLLTKVVFKVRVVDAADARAKIAEQYRLLGPFSRPEKGVMVVFVGVAVLWICRSLLHILDKDHGDTIIALAGALVLFIWPSGENGTDRPATLLDWKTAVTIPWGIILLFGGGLSLAGAFKTSGLAQWIGDQLVGLEGLPLFMIILLTVAIVNFLTEVTSNVATASIILPILASMAIAFGMHPFALTIGATLAASCAFMLPVATAPNAIVFGSDRIEMRDMVKAGFWLNILSIILISLLVYYLVPLTWGVDFNATVAIP